MLCNSEFQGYRWLKYTRIPGLTTLGPVSLFQPLTDGAERILKLYLAASRFPAWIQGNMKMMQCWPCSYVTSHDKGDFSDVIKSTNCLTLSSSKRHLSVRTVSPTVAEENGGGVWGCSNQHWRRQLGYAKSKGRVQKAKGGLQLTASRRMKVSILQLQGTEFYHYPWFSPISSPASKLEGDSVDTLVGDL